MGPLTTMCQTYPYTENCATSFLCHRSHLCSHRRVATLCQLTGEPSGGSENQEEEMEGGPPRLRPLTDICHLGSRDRARLLRLRERT